MEWPSQLRLIDLSIIYSYSVSFTVTQCPLQLLSILYSYSVSFTVTQCPLQLLSVLYSYSVSFTVTQCPLQLLSVLYSYSVSFTVTQYPLQLLSVLYSYSVSFTVTQYPLQLLSILYSYSVSFTVTQCPLQLLSILYSYSVSSTVTQYPLQFDFGDFTSWEKNRTKSHKNCHSRQQLLVLTNMVKPVFRGHLNIPECPYLKGFPLSQIPWHGGGGGVSFWENTWSEGGLSSKCPLKTGFTLHVHEIYIMFMTWLWLIPKKYK